MDLGSFQNIRQQSESHLFQERAKTKGTKDIPDGLLFFQPQTYQEWKGEQEDGEKVAVNFYFF